MDQLQTINILENDSATQSIISALSNTSLAPSNLSIDSKNLEDGNCNITVICQSYDNPQKHEKLHNGLMNSNHNKISGRHQPSESIQPNKSNTKGHLTNNTTCYSCKNCVNAHVLHDSSHFNSKSQASSIAPVTSDSIQILSKLKSLTSTNGNNNVPCTNNQNSSESINGSNLHENNINVESKVNKKESIQTSKYCVPSPKSNVNNNNTEHCSSQLKHLNQNCNLENASKLNTLAAVASGGDCCFSGQSSPYSNESNCTIVKLQNELNLSTDEHDDSVDSSIKDTVQSIVCNPFDGSSLCNNDEIIGGIKYVSYKSELQMPDIIKLIQKDLSEPYSIYTYRYFIHNWPKFCFLAMDGEKCVGAIVCKLDIHRKVIRRGYIAMLAVDENFRKMKIGSNLVLKAIRAMVLDDADEVVLETEITNRPALKLYENLGFVRDKRLFRYYLNGVDALRLKLWLR